MTKVHILDHNTPKTDIISLISVQEQEPAFLVPFVRDLAFRRQRNGPKQFFARISETVRAREKRNAPLRSPVFDTPH